MSTAHTYRSITLRGAGRLAKAATPPRGLSRARRAACSAAEALERRCLLAGGGPVGDEFQVNTFTAGNQFIGFTARQVDADDAGNFVVVWSSGAQDGSGYGVYAQRYDAAGAPQGAEFRVNTSTTGNQHRPTVAMDADGDFIVAWESLHNTNFGEIYAQRYNAAGVAQGGELLVNVITTGIEEQPVVVCDDAGNFVVTWQHTTFGGPSGGFDDIYARRFDASGNPLSDDILVNTYTTQLQRYPSASMDDDGDFVIAWNSTPQDGSPGGFFSYQIYAQRFNAAGAPQGGEFKVSHFTDRGQLAPNVAHDVDGNFVISFQAIDTPGFGAWDVYARRYDAGGVAQGGQFIVNTFSDGQQQLASVACDPAGEFIVTWQSYGQDGSGEGLYAQRFSASGAPLGGEFQVNSYTSFDQRQPGLAFDGDGDFVVVWTSAYNQDGDGNGVFAQRYQDVAPPVTWDGGGNGTHWSDPLNWSGDVVPGPADDVVISVAGDPTIQISATAESINSLQCDEALVVLNGGSLELASTSSIADFTLNAGTLSGNGDVTVTGTFNWVNGAQRGGGTTTIPAGASMNLSFGFLLRTLEVAGTATHSGSDNLFFGDNAGTPGSGILHIKPGGVFNHTGEGDFGQLAVTTQHSIINEGTINRSGPGTTVYGGFDIAFTNHGTVNLESGGLTIATVALTHNGTIAADAGTLLTLGSDGTYSYGASSTITGAGAANFANGTHTFGTGNYALTGDLTIGIATVNFNDALTVANFTQNNGVLGGSGHVTVTGNYTLATGIHRGSGKTIIPAGATMSIGSIFLVRTLEIAGTATHSGSDNLFFGDNAGTPGSGMLHIMPGGVFNHTGEGDVGQLAVTEAHSIINEGTINRSGPGTTVYGGFNIAFINHGTVNLDEGTIHFANVSLANDGTILTTAGTSLIFATEGAYGVASSMSGPASATFASGTHTFGPGNYGLSGPITLNGGIANFNDSLSVPSVTHNGGVLGGDGHLTITGNYTQVNGIQRGGGTTIIAPGATMDITFVYLVRTLEIAGTATHSGGPGDNIYFGDNAGSLGSGIINVLPGGVWNSVGQGAMSMLGPNGSAHEFRNEGTFNRSGAGTTVIAGPDVAFINNGTVNVAAGGLSLQMEDGFTNTGSIVTSAGTSLTFGTDGTYGPASSITGPAAATFTSGTHTFGQGNYALSGPITLNGGIANFNESFAVPSVTHNGGVLGGDGHLTVTGNYTQVNGIQRGGGKTIIAAGATMDITFVYLVRTLEIAGTATHSGGMGDNIYFGDNAGSLGSGVIRVLPGGVWNSVGHGGMLQLAPNGSQHQFINDGTFNRSGTGTTFIGGHEVAFENNGTINLNEGGLSLQMQDGFENNAAIVTMTGTTLTFNTEGTYGTASTITGPASAIFLSGTHTFNAGNYALTGDLTLNAGVNFNESITVPSVIQNGILGGSGNLTITGNYTWVQGIQRGTGKTIIPAGATMNITFGYLQRTLEIAGAATHSGVPGDRILLGDAQSVNGVIHVLPSGVFNLVGPVGITPAGGGGAQLLHNEGTITRSGADASGIGGDGFSFDNAGTVDVQAGTLNLGVITMTNTGTLRAAGGATLNLGNTNTLFTAGSIDGDGDVVFAGPAQWSGGTMTGTGRTIVETTGGLTLTGSGLRASSRELDVRGFVAMQPGGALVLRTNALAIAPGAYLDVNDNALIVDYTGGSPLANIRAALASGYNAGFWNGPGIRSAAAGATTTRALGYAESAAIFSSFPATFAGQQVDNTAVLVRFTRYGDADLSGNVNLNDFNRLATSFGQANTAWTQGNFNYDGLTNLNDFNLLAANFGQTAGPDGRAGGAERLRNLLPGDEADVLDEALA